MTKSKVTNQKVPWNNFELVSDKNNKKELITLRRLTKGVNTINLSKEMNKVPKENIFKAKQSYIDDTLLNSKSVCNWNLINANIYI